MKKHYKMLFVLFLLSTQLVSAQRNGRMLFTARLTGAKEVPAVNTIAKGLITAVIVGNDVTINAVFDSLSGPVTACHFHKGSTTTTGSSITNYVSSVRGNRLYLKTTLTNAQIADMIEDSIYFNVHTTLNGSGEIRGQMVLQTDYLFDAFASGAQEVPAVASPASAVGSFVVSSVSGKIDYKVVANGLTGAITSAHLHYGAFGVSGGVAFPLTISGNTLVGSITPSTNSFLDSFFRGQIYLNIHTAANGGGEIRGQIFYEGDGIGFDGIIEGAQEIPAVTTTAKGAMYANIRSTLDTLDYGIQINGLTPTQAHFHSAAAGTSGPALINLTPVGAAFPNLYSGKIAVTPAILAALVRDSFYVNFHTAANAGGEIRGQVLSVLRTSLVANLCGGQETPAVTTNASGAGFMSLSRDKLDVSLDAVTNGLSSNATGAHIHRGEKGVAGPVVINLNSRIVGNATSGAYSLASVPAFADSVARGLTYFNFHNTANPNGEIRGQAAADLVQECLANATLELNGEKFAVKVAPNPVSSLLNISFNSNEELNAQIVITDLAGRQIVTQKAQILRGSNNIDVNVANWNNGIYFIQMRQANRLLFTEKVVKN